MNSVLFKLIGTSIVSINLIVLPLVPVIAQTSTKSNNSSTTANPDANVGNIPSNSNSSSTSTSTNPSVSNAPSTTASSSPAPSNPPASSSPAPSNAPQGNTNNKQNSDWSGIGLLGLLGLLGLVNLFRRQNARHSTNTIAQTNLSANLNSAGESLHNGIDRAGAETHNLLGQLNERIDDFKTHRAQEKEIKQIKNALGRPSKRVILDRQDNVILNVGELITHQSIERARGADMLDVLLDSVDTHEPEIANQDRVAPVIGEASLEKRESDNNN